MTAFWLGVIVVQLVAVLVGLVLLWRRSGSAGLDQLAQHLQTQTQLQERMERTFREEWARGREETQRSAERLREQLDVSHKRLVESLDNRMHLMQSRLDAQLDATQRTVEERLRAIQVDGGQRLDQIRQQSEAGVKETRQEVEAALKQFDDSLTRHLNQLIDSQRAQTGQLVAQLKELLELYDRRLSEVRQTVEQRLTSLQEDNQRNLEHIRLTVDEKLQGTLEKRLGDSFQLVSERLEQVHKGLGEMQALASGVGDLKRMLTNVRVRGTWGEVQLERMLEQIFSPAEYDKNVATKSNTERVEFALRLPGRGDDGQETIWLPIDAKFPLEAYQRLQEAQEQADAAAVEEAGRQLEQRLVACAADIRNKYVAPPQTTDFAILFLPTEGLYAEALRRPGLQERLQRDYGVVIAGPTTLYAILVSFQVGFRTLAIQKRSSEVWKLLGAIKTEFGKYGELLDKVRKKLNEATNTIDDASKRTRTITQKLRSVEQLPVAEARDLLSLPPAEDDAA
jgi:DNA recombination protein RmuC